MIGWWSYDDIVDNTMAALKKLGVPLLRHVLRSGPCTSLSKLSIDTRVPCRNVSDEPYAPEPPPVTGKLSSSAASYDDS